MPTDTKELSEADSKLLDERIAERENWAKIYNTRKRPEDNYQRNLNNEMLLVLRWMKQQNEASHE